RLDYNILEEKINEIRQKPSIRFTASFHRHSEHFGWRNAHTARAGAHTSCDSDDYGRYHSVVGSRTIWRNSRNVRLPVTRSARSPTVFVLKKRTTTNTVSAAHALGVC